MNYRIIEILLLPPVLKGFLSLVAAGTVFPISGVMIMRMNLLQMRFMLTHGVILGGAIALASGVGQLPVIIAANLLIVGILIKLSGSGGDAEDSAAVLPGRVSAFLMVLTIGAAGIIIHKYNVPAGETLSILWGSPFTLNTADIAVILGVCLLQLLYVIIFFRKISALLFNPDLAASSGVNVRLHRSVLILIIALTTAAAIKLLGALLVDALMILPAFAAASFSGSLKRSLFNAGLLGLIFSFSGFLLSLVFDWPVSGGIALTGGIVFALLMLFQRRNK